MSGAFVLGAFSQRACAGAQYINARYTEIDYEESLSKISESSVKLGRRAVPSTTRDAVLQAARHRFATAGFAGTTIRPVAADAGVDPALVLQFYRSKDELFVACLAVSPQAIRAMAEAFDGPVDALGDQVARAFLGLWAGESADAPALLAMLRAAVANEVAGEVIRDFVQARLVEVIAPKLEGSDAALRAGLVAAMLMGVVLGRQIVCKDQTAGLTAIALLDAAPDLPQARRPARYRTGEAWRAAKGFWPRPPKWRARPPKAIPFLCASTRR